MTDLKIEVVPADASEDSVPFEKEDDLPPEKMDDSNRTRELIAQEERSANDYEQLADESDSDDAKDIYEDIADEEKVHAGELLILLLQEDPDQAECMEEAEKESDGKSFREMFSEGRNKVLAKAMGCDSFEIEKATDVGRYSKKTTRKPLGRAIDKYKQNTEFRNTSRQKQEADDWMDRHVKEQAAEQEKMAKLRQKFGVSDQAEE